MTVNPNFSVPFKTYEELPGASGRHVFFRAPRVRARELFSGETLETETAGAVGKLWDISISGLSFIAQDEREGRVEIGAVVPFKIRRARSSVCEGFGTVIRSELTFHGQKIALKYVDNCVDLDDLRRRCVEDALIEEEEALTPPAPMSDVEQGYRILCTEFLEFTHRIKKELERAESLNPRLRHDAEAQKRILTLTESTALPEFIALIERSNHLLEAAHGKNDLYAMMKRLTVDLITPAFLGGPGWWQSFMKPLGYPGDFLVMNYFYDGGDYGETLYDKLMHRLGLCVAHFVKARMEYVRDVLHRRVVRGGDQPCRVLSLASGPAEEIASLMRSTRALPKVDFTLVDQDLRALSFAYEGIYPAITHNHPEARLRCLQASFVKLIKGGDLLGENQQQDLIYSIGLLDYLKPKRARALVEGLYAQLAPGGQLIVGNMRATPTGCRWVTDLLCDWELIYRNEQEMLALAAGLEEAPHTLTTDKTGQVFFLTIEKPVA